MSRRHCKLITLSLSLFLLIGCNDVQWDDASKFEQKIDCQTSLAITRKVAEDFQMKIKEVSFQVENVEKTVNINALMLFKGNTAYNLDYEDGKLRNIQKQGFRTWGIGKGFKETISVESFLRCNRSS